MIEWQSIIGPALGAFLTVVAGSAAAWYLSRVRAGRLGRTLEQGTQILEFSERWQKLMRELQSSNIDNPAVKELMAKAVNAVNEDFAAERQVFQKFGKSKGTVRDMLWLRVPSRPAVWIPQIAMQVLLLFAIFVVTTRLVDGDWSMNDAVIIGVSVTIALTLRLTLRRAV